MKARVIKRAFVVSLLVVLAACRGHRETSSDGSTATTQTVAPAAAQPAPTGTDAMTQTVDVEAGRSEEDGGASTATTATTAKTAKAPAKTPAKKTKKH